MFSCFQFDYKLHTFDNYAAEAWPVHVDRLFLDGNNMVICSSRGHLQSCYSRPVIHCLHVHCLLRLVIHRSAPMQVYVPDNIRKLALHDFGAAEAALSGMAGQLL